MATKTEKTEWGRTVAALLDSDDDPERPDSWRALARTLASLDGATQNAASWKKTLERMRAGKVSERNAVWLAEALRVPRESLPASSERPTIRRVESKLDRLRREVGELAARVTALEAEVQAEDPREAEAEIRRLHEAGRRRAPARKRSSG